MSKWGDIDLEEVSRLAGLGLNIEQIASSLGIGESTLFQWKKEKVEFSEAIKKGKAKAIQEVSNALFEKAITGDNVSMIFFLKNRSRKEWGEQEEKTVTVKVQRESDLDNLSNEELEKIANE